MGLPLYLLVAAVILFLICWLIRGIAALVAFAADEEDSDSSFVRKLIKFQEEFLFNIIGIFF